MSTLPLVLISATASVVFHLDKSIERSKISILPSLLRSPTLPVLGGGVITAALTLTTTLSATLPPAPVQVNVKVLVDVRLLVTSVPLTTFVPDQPLVALQLVALVDVQERVVVTPLLIEMGPSELLTLRSTVGAGGGALVTV